MRNEEMVQFIKDQRKMHQTERMGKILLGRFFRREAFASPHKDLAATAATKAEEEVKFEERFLQFLDEVQPDYEGDSEPLTIKKKASK